MLKDVYKPRAYIPDFAVFMLWYGMWAHPELKVLSLYFLDFAPAVPLRPTLFQNKHRGEVLIVCFPTLRSLTKLRAYCNVPIIWSLIEYINRIYLYSLHLFLSPFCYVWCMAKGGQIFSRQMLLSFGKPVWELSLIIMDSNKNIESYLGIVCISLR